MDSLEMGICRLAVLPVRSNPSHQSEMTTQLLFGDHYRVLELSQDRQWMRIEIHFDSYQGWLAANQHTPISKEYYDQINQSDFHITVDHHSQILLKNEYIHLLIASIVPVASGELFNTDPDFSFQGVTKSRGKKWDYERLIGVATKYLHAPYLWGGKTPFGIDCSGFIQQVFKICGYPLPRDAYQQVSHGTKVIALNEARPGDLIFFNNEKGKIDHVGLLMNHGEIMHASGRVRIDGIDEKGIINRESGLRTHKLCEIRRILK